MGWRKIKGWWVELINGGAGVKTYNPLSRNLKSETLQWSEQLFIPLINQLIQPNKRKITFLFFNLISLVSWLVLFACCSRHSISSINQSSWRMIDWIPFHACRAAVGAAWCAACLLSPSINNTSSSLPLRWKLVDEREIDCATCLSSAESSNLIKEKTNRPPLVSFLIKKRRMGKKNEMEESGRASWNGISSRQRSLRLITHQFTSFIGGPLFLPRSIKSIHPSLIYKPLGAAKLKWNKPISFFSFSKRRNDCFVHSAAALYVSALSATLINFIFVHSLYSFTNHQFISLCLKVLTYKLTVIILF